MTPPGGAGRASVASVQRDIALRRHKKVAQREAFAGRDRLRYGRRDAATGAARPAAGASR